MQIKTSEIHSKLKHKSYCKGDLSVHETKPLQVMQHSISFVVKSDPQLHELNYGFGFKQHLALDTRH